MKTAEPYAVERWTSSRGDLRHWVAAPGISVSQMVGHFDVSLLEPFLDAGTRVFSGGEPQTVFHDWQQMTGYDSDVRTKLTHWASAHRSQIRGIHILVRAKIVAMGVTVASVFLDGLLTSYTDRSDFQRALDAATLSASSRRR